MMKKLFATFLLAATLSLTACTQMYNANSCKSNVEAKGYEASVYSAEETMKRYEGFDFKDLKLSGGLSATKGSGDDKDGIVAFFFESVNDADAFVKKDDTLRFLNIFVDKIIGENLSQKAKVGIHNNVAYAGSEYSFNAAFNM